MVVERRTGNFSVCVCSKEILISTAMCANSVDVAIFVICSSFLAGVSFLKRYWVVARFCTTHAASFVDYDFCNYNECLHKTLFCSSDL